MRRAAIRQLTNFLKTVDYNFIEECVDRAVTRVFMGEEETVQPDLSANYHEAGTNSEDVEAALLAGLDASGGRSMTMSSSAGTALSIRGVVDKLAMEVWEIRQVLVDQGLLDRRSNPGSDRSDPGGFLESFSSLVLSSDEFFNS